MVAIHEFEVDITEPRMVQEPTDPELPLDEEPIAAEMITPDGLVLEEDEEEDSLSIGEKTIDIPTEDVLSPKRALSSLVEDFSHFESLHARFPVEALVVFSSVATLREALREFRELPQVRESLPKFSDLLAEDS